MRTELSEIQLGLHELQNTLEVGHFLLAVKFIDVHNILASTPVEVLLAIMEAIGSLGEVCKVPPFASAELLKGLVYLGGRFLINFFLTLVFPSS